MFERVLGGLGASDTGKLFTKEGMKAKTAQSLALDKAEEIYFGERRDFSTKPMEHGTYSEPEAFETVVQPTYPDAVYCSEEPILIKKFSDDAYLWATPDVTTTDKTGDIKCPYSITSYFDNIRSLNNNYIIQNQTQTMATGHKQGFIVFYLTSHKVDEFGNKTEYNISINDRHKFFPLLADESIQKEILARAEEFFPMRDKILKTLESAQLVSEEELFKLALDGKKITPYKKKSNLLTWENKIIYNPVDGFLILE